MKSITTRTILIAAALAVAIASPAAAQSPSDPARVEFGLGYSMLVDREVDETLMAGWLANAGIRAHSKWWVIGEAGGHYKKLAADHQIRVHAFMGGLRYARETEGSVRPFVQVLLGVACYCGSLGTDGKARKSFAIQPGAGIDIPVRGTFWARLQADYRSVRDRDEPFDQFRFSAGGVWFFGGSR